MLKLHSLEIAGFKSFVERTEVRFATGVTAIVGPNGCGKSNLSDAITWVLGEQSAKSLRGEKMEDVIFSGSDRRQPVGMAEVGLRLETDPDFPHSVDGRIELQRQVFRSGESRYRINGKNVRLREIRELLMDTGLGIRAYSVIEQGKIGLILSGKPQERRKLLEEAAGITRYKERKRLAEIKLEETLGNLQRIDDIVAEVDRSIKALKRQASAARRYQAAEKEQRDLLRQVLLGRFVEKTERLEILEKSLRNETDKEAALLAELHRLEAAIAQGREQLDRLARELAEKHQAFAQLAALIEGRQEFLKGARQRATELEERRRQGRQTADERQRQTSEFRLSLGSLDERTRDLLLDRDAAAQQVGEDDRKIAAAQLELQAAEKALEVLRQDLLAAGGQVNAMRSAVHAEIVEIERSAYRQRFLEEERQRINKQVEESAGALARILEKVAADEGRLAELSEKRVRLAHDLEALLRRESELQEERRQLETDLANRRQRLRLLTELSAEHLTRRKALLERLRAVGLEDPRFLADIARPAAGWADAIDFYLKDLAEAVVLDESNDPLALARALVARKGSATFLSGPGAPLPELEDKALAFSLAEALDLPEELGRALPPAFLVRQAEDAARLARAHPGVAFLSQENVWAQNGVLQVRGEAANPGVLARESERKAIQQEMPKLERRLEELSQQLKSLVETRSRHATEMNRLDEQTGEIRREIAVAQARRQDADARAQKFRLELERLTKEQAELGVQLAGRQAKRAELAAGLEATEKKQTDLTAAFDSGQAEVEAARARREALRTESAGRRGRLALLEERLNAHNSEVVRMNRQITYTEEQLEIWKGEDTTLEKRQNELNAAVLTAEQELQSALERRSAAQEAVLAQQEKLDAAREASRLEEEQVKGRRSVRDAQRGTIESLRIDQAGLRQDAEHLAFSFRDAFKQSLPGFGKDKAEKLEAEPDSSTVAADELKKRAPSELVELEAELARAKDMLERLGPVNVLAADEYEEQSTRFDELSRQRADIADSVASLRATITEINITSSERFKATFDAVNATFGTTFQKLFRGGEAEMRLFDEDDLLETGIEIIARPPGKRPQNIQLLSGGEKALTAVALLFALFQAKPSPFCILDEVDAPLDDVNVLRFVEVLKELAKDTQFLIITHNKLTMEAASSLYGVTMEEKGISKLVRAALDELHPLVDEPMISA